MTVALKHRPRELTGRHVLMIVVGFFAVVIGVDTLFAVQAYRSFSGQVAKDPYEAGLLFNRVIAQRRLEASLGWSADAVAEAGTVRVRVLDAAGAAVPGLTVEGVLERPATEAGRQTLHFTAAGPGAFTAPARLDGAWDFHAVARDTRGRLLEIEKRFVRP